MTDPSAWIGALLPAGRLIVLCGRADDAQAWRDLFGADRCLALPLDDVALTSEQALRGATDQLTWQHRLIADIDGPSPLAHALDGFDPHRSATLLIPDPLDPPETGTRLRFGQRRPEWRLLEHKYVIDALWDSLGVLRAPSILADGPVDLASLGRLVDQGSGVVCSCQTLGDTPSAGGDDIWWWRDGGPPSACIAGPGVRVRLMPLLEGVPVRLHGLVTTGEVIAFPPMEIVALPRPDRGTFLCAGAVTTLGDLMDLRAATEPVGAALHTRLGYLGAFAVDGILTENGFRPTDLNARLTSAMEAAPSPLRVRLHAANLLAREGVALDPPYVQSVADEIFTQRNIHTLYGAATRAKSRLPQEVRVRWCGSRLVAVNEGPVHGRLTITRSARGWLLTAALLIEHVPGGGLLGPVAPEVLRLTDEVLGTDFGPVASSHRCRRRRPLTE